MYLGGGSGVHGESRNTRLQKPIWSEINNNGTTIKERGVWGPRSLASLRLGAAALLLGMLG